MTLQEYNDNTPYSYRATAGGMDIGDCSIESDILVGGTIVWNQIVKNGNFSNTNNWAMYREDTSYQPTFNVSNNEANVTVKNKGDRVQQAVNMTNGHKYFLTADIYNPGSVNIVIYWGGSRITCGNNSDFVNRSVLFEGDKTTGSYGLSARIIANTSEFTFTIKNIKLIDVTKALGSSVADAIYSMEQDSSGSGITILKNMFPEAYYEYCEGKLESVNVAEHIMRDSDNHIIGRYGYDSSITLRGIPKVDESGSIYYDGDVYSHDGYVRKLYGIRSYQSGDESLTDAVTDGVNTVYRLLSPSYDWAYSFIEKQRVEADGTEEYVDYQVIQGNRDVAVPVGHYTTYMISDALKYNELYKMPLLKSMSIEVIDFYPTVVITNENIVSEQMSLTKSLCSESNVRYGCCESACFKIRIANTNIPELTGQWLEVKQDIVTDALGYLLTQDRKYLLTEDGEKIKLSDTNIEEASVILGRFKVYSDKPTNDRMWRDLVCYDLMYDILHADVSDWIENISFPMTLEDLRNSFFVSNFIGMDEVGFSLINDSLVVDKGFIADGTLSGKTVLEAICELNGVFGIINQKGKFEFLTLAYGDKLTLDYYQDGTGKYEDYVTEPITGIRAIGSNNDPGTTVGTTDNLYIIENNPLINGIEGTQELEDALQRLLGVIENDSFRPFQVTTYGNPMLPLGTKITINTRNQTINSFVINKEMTGVQSLKDEIGASSEKYQPVNTNSVANEIKRTKGKIVLKVDSNGKIVQVALSADADTGSEFKVKADNIAFIANDTIELTTHNLAINSDNFTVDSSGNLWCQNADITGKISATTGSIGGWTIDANRIYGGDATTGVALMRVPNANQLWVFAAGGTSHSDYNTCPFRVSKSGALYASSGNISGFTLSSDGIYYKYAQTYSGITSDYWALVAGSPSSSSFDSASFRVNTAGLAYMKSAWFTNATGDPGTSLPQDGSVRITSSSLGSSIYMYNSSGSYTITMQSGGNNASLNVSGGIFCDLFSCSGTKSRVVETKNYGNKLLYCYETPTPMFGDIGEGKIAEDGKCYIWLDSTFSETIKTESYQVFLQKYGQGECYVTERTERCFVVEGTPNMSFGWEIKARQMGFENNRLETFYPNNEAVIETLNYGKEAIKHFKDIENEREVA